MNNHVYSSKIEYDYTVNKKTYTSRTIKMLNLGFVGSDIEEVKKNDVYCLKYNKGDIIQVFYCPLYPKLSYVERLNNWVYVVLSIIIISLIIYIK